MLGSKRLAGPSTRRVKPWSASPSMSVIRPKRLDVAEKLFIARGRVAVGSDDEFVRPVEDTLRLREVEAVDERFRRGRIECGEHLAGRQVREQTGVEFRRRDEAAGFERERIGGVAQEGVAAGARGRAGARAEREHPAAEFGRVERRDGLERGEIVLEDMG